jgi:CBS domain containing-hemolysin-like protein
MLPHAGTDPASVASPGGRQDVPAKQSSASHEVQPTVSAFFWIALIASAVLSGFFALTSNALRMFRRSQLEQVFASERVELVERLETHLKSLRLASSLLRSCCNLILVLCVLELMDAPGKGIGVMALGVLISAVIIAVVGVAIPHAWASYNGERVLARALPILLALRWIIWPVTRVMEAFDLPVRRLAGIGEEDEQMHNESVRQEIVQAASEGQAEGAVDPDEVEMIESVIELGETQAGEIMTPRTEIFALPLETTWSDAAQKIFEAGHSRVPVYQADLDNIVGILYAKDMLAHVVENHAPQDLRKTLRKPFFVPETKLLDDLLREFKARKLHLAVILDEYGGTAGLVTIEDVLEEIVGDISDEYDQIAPALLKRLGDSEAEIDGRLHVDEINDAMALEIPEDEDYDTVAGFVFSHLGYIPQAGETLEANGARFTVLEATERRIAKLKVEVLQHAGVEGESA